MNIINTLAVVIAAVSGFIAVTCVINYLALPVFIAACAVIAVRLEKRVA